MKFNAAKLALAAMISTAPIGGMLVLNGCAHDHVHAAYGVVYADSEPGYYYDEAHFDDGHHWHAREYYYFDGHRWDRRDNVPQGFIARERRAERHEERQEHHDNDHRGDHD